MSRSQRGRLPSASPTCSKAGRTCAALAACGDGGEADMTPAGAPRGLPSPATQPAAPRGAAVRWTASPAARVRRDRFCLSWMSSPTPGGGAGRSHRRGPGSGCLLHAELSKLMGSDPCRHKARHSGGGGCAAVQLVRPPRRPSGTCGMPPREQARYPASLN